jgi:ferric-dicitrate binding protein FerR (iron transport regulator)
VSKQITTIEDILSDENFLAWYFKTDEKKAAGWNQWLAENAAFAPLVQEAIAYLDEIHIEEKEVPAQQTEAAFARLDLALDNEHSKGAVIVKRQFSWWVPAVAAAVLVMAGIFFFKGNNEPVKTKVGSSYGQISEYKLPDGSEVLLNANSAVTINKNWKENDDREVWVDGEAFFHVQKTAAKNKFIVHAKGLDIIVTGTKFNVINREKETSVLLTEGSVTIRTKEGKEIKMKPGEFIVVEKNIPAKKPANEEKILAWKQKSLLFDSTKIEDVGAIIKHHYGVAVIVADDVKGETVSGMMQNDNLDVLLLSLEGTEDFKIIRTDKNILISKPE